MSTPNPFSFPIVMTAAGLQPQPPSSLLTQLLAAVAATNPGYTANLPSSMVDDISSTDVAAISLIDQAKVELVNSLSPNAANAFLLGQLGQIYINQTMPGLPTSTSVPVIFSGTVGWVIPNGFLVGDGTNTYQVQTGGVIASGGSTTSALTAICISSTDSFAVPANTVTTLLTSVPSTISLSVNNPNEGTPGDPSGESYSSFRARVLTAGLASSVGTGRYIKTLLGIVPNIAQNSIAVQQVSGGGIRVMASGGDQYDIANAIYMSIADPSELVGSAINSGRNVAVSLIDYPDDYTIPYVNTPTQTVTMAITWNTSLSSFTGGGAFAGLVQPPLVAYINSLAPGQQINVMEMNAIFQNAIANTLNPALLNRLVFSVSINSVVTNPGTGTYGISGDPESNFFTAVDGTGITVVQG